MARSGKGGIVIVANRLPVQRTPGREGWSSSAGGLVTAMKPVLQTRSGSWVGWTGAAGPAPRPFTHDGVRIRPVRLSTEEIRGFYEGMSNSTFWPLYHDAIRAPEFRREWWRPYVQVNRRYAEAAAAAARPGDVVWVHDYHLQLVPLMLRDLLGDRADRIRIGFFLHIPFPPEELFAWLPWRTEVLRSLLGADLVGFQTHASAQNFVRAVRNYRLADGAEGELMVDDRVVRAASFPISIDFNWFEEQAMLPETMHRAVDIRRRLGPRRRVLLAVDRLDYTKGIPERLLAFGELLRSKQATVDDCVLVQIAVPSRESVGEYAGLRDAIERTVGRINGEYSHPGQVAVHYFRRNLTREEIVGFYRAADVMLVTPLRDGMNLVAKEYVATRTDNTGVLVLSEFAGAARELRRALIVNPRDVDQMRSTMHAALTLPAEDASQRMAILRTVCRRHDVQVWAESFLEAMRT